MNTSSKIAMLTIHTIYPKKKPNIRKKNILTSLLTKRLKVLDQRFKALEQRFITIEPIDQRFILKDQVLYYPLRRPYIKTT